MTRVACCSSALVLERKMNGQRRFGERVGQRRQLAGQLQGARREEIEVRDSRSIFSTRMPVSVPSRWMVYLIERRCRCSAAC